MTAGFQVSLGSTTERRARGLLVIRTVTEMGYQVIIVDGRHFRANRLIFLYMTGKMPDGEVRRLSGMRLDNRWANLKVGRF